MKVLKKLYSSFILLILGILIINNVYVFKEGCLGFANVILFILLSGIFTLIFITIQIVLLIRYLNKNKPFNFFPLITGLVTVTGIYFALHPEKFESPVIIKANTCYNVSLLLKQNGSFTIKIPRTERSCYLKGKYKISKDTLILLKNDILSKTDSSIYNKYLIDSARKRMYPIKLHDETNDSLKWLTISFL